MRRIALLNLIILSGLLLIGCSEGKQDLEQWVNQTLARPPGNVEPLPQIVTPEPVVYDAYDLRDPFMRPRPDQQGTAAASSGPRPDPDRRREFLEQFPLDSLDMVGTISIGDQTYGLISDPEDTIHRVSEGNYLGRNHGRILQVTPVAVEVMELVPDGAEGWMEREARIALPDDDRQG
ncbi:MAG: pilus assembly protein PilP [Wenzhouxiangellaceae bacterium]|nr:pilus assembly protein PilP [Wenzhouxiangellaceae bacterium]MBS3746648.1 pilus assembly protein PilP [Wenzhouxiangellaceae bacterium]MBS3823462.1 pilus assembly protein PilP [Wenzhouxiangellaceae bacterium]